jgi:hypothetical protein
MKRLILTACLLGAGCGGSSTPRAGNTGIATISVSALIQIDFAPNPQFLRYTLAYRFGSAGQLGYTVNSLDTTLTANGTTTQKHYGPAELNALWGSNHLTPGQNKDVVETVDVPTGSPYPTRAYIASTTDDAGNTKSFSG